MDIDQNDTHQEIKDKAQKERRGFLKKSVYAAPVLIALGQLVKPQSAKADFGGPPSDVRPPIW